MSSNRPALASALLAGCARLAGCALAAFALAGCSGGSAPAAASSTGALAAGASCPTTAEFATLTSGAVGADGEKSFALTVCDGEWAATTFTVNDVPGRAALKWDGSAWTPVLVGGADGPCPATVKSAPDDIREVLGC